MKCWILSTPRTGGNYLSQILNRTGLFVDKKKHPFDEWLGFYNYRQNLDWFLSENQISNWLPTKDWFLSDTPNFINLHRDQFFNAFKDDSYNFFKLKFKDVKYLLLKRNFFSQVASLYVAKMTKVWRIYDEKQLEYYANKLIDVNSKKIIECYQEEINKKNAWFDFDKKPDVMNIAYEDLNNNTEHVIKQILNFLDLPLKNIEQSIRLTNKNYLKTQREETKKVEIILKRNIGIL